MKATKTPVSWTLNAAALEFGIDRAGLKRRLADARQNPDAAGCFSTRQICEAVFGSLHAEKLRKNTAERRLAELELARQERRVLPAKDVERAWSFLLQAVRARWLQLPARSVLAFALWPDARAAEAWVQKAVEEILGDLAANPDYSGPDEVDDEEEPAKAEEAGGSV